MSRKIEAPQGITKLIPGLKGLSVELVNLFSNETLIAPRDREWFDSINHIIVQDSERFIKTAEFVGYTTPIYLDSRLRSNIYGSNTTTAAPAGL